MTKRGSCHCGNVAFDVDAPLDEAMECNCSHCARKGYLLAFVPRGVLTLDPIEGDLHTYRFNKHSIAHYFCGTCGCAPYAEGTGPDGSEMAAVNLRCIEGIDLSQVKSPKSTAAAFSNRPMLACKWRPPALPVLTY